jgi:hypothetical protein
MILALTVLAPAVVMAADPAAAIDGASTQIDLWAASAGAAGLAVILDFVFRLKATEKALSLAWVAVGILKSLSRAAEATAKALDKVLPQRTKKP